MVDYGTSPAGQPSPSGLQCNPFIQRDHQQRSSPALPPGAGERQPQSPPKPQPAPAEQEDVLVQAQRAVDQISAQMREGQLASGTAAVAPAPAPRQKRVSITDAITGDAAAAVMPAPAPQPSALVVSAAEGAPPAKSTQPPHLTSVLSSSQSSTRRTSARGSVAAASPGAVAASPHREAAPPLAGGYGHCGYRGIRSVNELADGDRQSVKERIRRKSIEYAKQ